MNMKRNLMLIVAMCMVSAVAFAQKTIRVSTDKTDLVLKVSPKGRLYQVYLGDKLRNPADYDHLPWEVYASSDAAVSTRGHEAYAASGCEDFFEPAVAVTHADGNKTTYLYYQDVEQKAVNGGTETIITLRDQVYPLTVRLHYVAYPKENVIKAWSEISHQEKAPVTLWRYSSVMLYFKADRYFLTSYHGDWAREGQPETAPLTHGKKVIDTKLGTRAAMQTEPFFELGFDEPAKENEGRLTLLNNWENTGFDFDQQTLAELMKDAKDLGVDLFLLDDGWFANKYPRKDDRAGLGDWEPTKGKLPEGIPGLVRDAKKAGVKFGIWIEPEMVNPKSELFEKHPDWAIMQPNREPYYHRHQLVLDISNPKVQDYVFGIVDRIMTENPDVAYFKWDCNSVVTNIFSPYHKANQGNFYIDHIRGIYHVLTRIHDKYPDLPMMLCSGGGGRMDYEMLKYFTEFWCSDDTDPYERIYIQWGLSKFFPAKTMSSHVTNWNRNTSVKFRTDVCSSCKLGFDIDLKSLSAEEYQFVKQAVSNYDLMKPVIFDGDLYRLVSPYEGNHCAINYVSKDQQRAVLFAFDLHPRYMEPLTNVRLQGLDPDRTYTVRETNLMPGKKSELTCDGKQYSGDYLMKVGLSVFTPRTGNSHVLILE